MTVQQLILDNLALVPHIARKVFPAGHADQNVKAVGTWDDLLSEGNVALCKAAKHFDPERGFRFSTYAWRCIYLALIKYVLGYSGLIRGPKRGRFTKDSYEHWRQTTPRAYCGNDELLKRVAHLPEPEEPYPNFDALLAKLAPEERRLVQLYFWEGQNLATIGARKGLSRQAISLRLRRVLAKLRHQLERVSA